MPKIDTSNIWEKIIITVVFLVGILIIALIDKNVGEDKTIDNNTTSTPAIVGSEGSEFPDYEYYKEMKKIKLVDSVKSWVEEPEDKKSVEGRTYKRFIKVDNGNIANGYLFVDVSVDNGKPLTVWDSIYVSLRKIVNGYLYVPKNGHLLRSKSITIPKSNRTLLLYDLRQIPLTNLPYSDNNSFKNENWLSLLQEANKFELETFISTLRKGGEIHEITIGYECLETTPNCELQIIEE